MKRSITRSSPLSASLSLDHKAAWALAFVVAQISVMYTCYRVGHTEGVRESGGMLTDLPYTLEGFHILISFFLGVCVLGMWFRRAWSLIISSLGLVSILVIYGYWRFISLRYLSELESNAVLYRRVQQEMGWFLGATRWDFILLALVAILLVWHLFTLIKITRERGSTSTVS